jgi:hypothetical protein
MLSVNPTHAKPGDRVRPELRPQDILDLIWTNTKQQELVEMFKKRMSFVESPRLYMADGRIPPDVKKSVMNGRAVHPLWEAQLYSMFAVIQVR